MWKCKSCGEELTDAFDTCWKCLTNRDGSISTNSPELELDGHLEKPKRKEHKQRVINSNPDIKYCKCGHKAERSDKFCPNCGGTLIADGEKTSKHSDKRKTTINDKNKRVVIIGFGLAGLLLISVVVGTCAKNNDVKITSSKAIERVMDDLNVSDNRLNISSFDATDPAQVKKLLEDYKKQFKAAGIDINYRYFEYLVLLNNRIFPMELDDISIDDFRAFFRSIDETIIAVVESNLKTMPDSYISLADTYGKRNPIDRHFVDLFERLQVEVVNSCRNDSEEEMTRIIDSYFKFQLEFIIKGESFIVDESEVTFESLGIRAKEKILLSTIFINRYLMQKDFIPQFIVCEEYNRETMKTEPVKYPLSVIQDMIDELYKDNRHQMKIEKFSGGDYVHTK